MSEPLKLSLMPQKISICRLPWDEPIPEWACRSSFFSVTRTPDELSVVCDRKDVPPEIRSEAGWRIYKVHGPLDFSMTGVLSALATPLAGAGISIFALSTFDTDYLLVREADLEASQEILCRSFEIGSCKAGK
jgi:hypothetical protein